MKHRIADLIEKLSIFTYLIIKMTYLIPWGTFRFSDKIMVLGIKFELSLKETINNFFS